jgi:hypothetical protein
LNGRVLKLRSYVDDLVGLVKNVLAGWRFEAAKAVCFELSSTEI